MEQQRQTLSFRELHQPGNPFILANAWDVGSARVLAALGAKALATSSAAHAFTVGLPDGGHISRGEAIAHGADLVAATTLPVSGDLENGYGHSPADTAATVTAAAAAGMAGCCIEDTALPDTSPYDRADAVARIEAAAIAAAKVPDRPGTGSDFFLVARADGVMLGTYDLDEAIERCKAYADVGADGVYIPLLPDLASVERVCKAVAVPVNVLAVGALASYSLADLAEAGVARVSLGSALARITHRALVESATDVLGGTLNSLATGASGSSIDALLNEGTP